MSDPLAALRAHALARTLGPRTSLRKAIDRLGYVQIDPLRSPARAQDLILFQRVEGYRVGDLERRYPGLDCEEDFLHNYGVVPRRVQRLLHPRTMSPRHLRRQPPGLMDRVLAMVQAQGEVRPREVEAAIGGQSVTDAWGQGSTATTRALEGLLYRGLVRVVRREKGTRVYAPATHLPTDDEAGDEADRARQILDLLVRQYAPLPEASLRYLIQLCGYGVPHLKAALRAQLKGFCSALASTQVDGVTYLWPADERSPDEVPPEVRIVAPFDPLVWDRRRFEHLHGWAYRFEAYTPAPRRQFGYYALPLFHGAKAIGWANLRLDGEDLEAELGYVDQQPRSRAFLRSLDEELQRVRVFLVGELEPRARIFASFCQPAPDATLMSARGARGLCGGGCNGCA